MADSVHRKQFVTIFASVSEYSAEMFKLAMSFVHECNKNIHNNICHHARRICMTWQISNQSASVFFSLFVVINEMIKS